MNNLVPFGLVLIPVIADITTFSTKYIKKNLQMIMKLYINMFFQAQFN